MPGESFEVSCCCTPIPGTTAPGIAPYVVSLNSLYGIVGIAPDGGVSVRTSGNTIYIGANGSAGLGTVTSVNATSSNNNLVVTGGPVTTTGTFAFSLAGALNSISGLVTAADKMIYTTALNAYAVADLTPFARTLLDDANQGAAQTTLGLLIGTNVQAWSADLDSFVTNASWAGADLTLAGSLTIGTTGFVTSDFGVGGDFTVTGATTLQNTTVTTIAGDGAGLTNLSAANIAAGTLPVTRGGTGNAVYAVGDLLTASTTSTIQRIADVAVGSYLMSGGVGVIPAWSTLKLPNAATIGDILYASGTNSIGRLADVATTNVLLSGGVGVAPAWGKVTLSHTTGIAGSGANADITSFANDVTFVGNVFMTAEFEVDGIFRDGTTFEGNSSDILTSTGTGVAWSNQIVVSTLTINSNLFLEGTVSGTTGNQIINKPNGTIKFAAAGATSILVTNNLAFSGTSFVQCTVNSNDTTLKNVWVSVTTGSFTIYANAAATADCIVYWELKQIS